MAKKKLEEIEITDEMLENLRPLRANIFKEFVNLGDKMDNDAVFLIFIQRSLTDIGVDIEEPYEQLSFNDFGKTLARVMELNDMEELFRTIERLSRAVPKT